MIKRCYLLTFLLNEIVNLFSVFLCVWKAIWFGSPENAVDPVFRTGGGPWGVGLVGPRVLRGGPGPHGLAILSGAQPWRGGEGQPHYGGGRLV